MLDIYDTTSRLHLLQMVPALGLAGVYSNKDVPMVRSAPSITLANEEPLQVVHYLSPSESAAVRNDFANDMLAVRTVKTTAKIQCEAAG